MIEVSVTDCRLIATGCRRKHAGPRWRYYSAISASSSHNSCGGYQHRILHMARPLSGELRILGSIDENMRKMWF